MRLNFTISLTLVLVSAFWIHASEAYKNTRKKTNNTQVREGPHCPQLTVQHGKVKYVLLDRVVSGVTPLNPNTKAVISCNPRFKPDRGLESLTLSCLSDGTWDGPVVNCTPACGVAEKAVEGGPLVVDAQDAHVGLLPWHAFIYERATNNGTWKQICGGSLVTERHVITAAHCVYDKEDEEENVAVALGKYFRSWSHEEDRAQKRNVSKILVPAEFSRVNFAFDFALVFLDRPIEAGGPLMPVCLGFPGGASNIKDKHLYIAGWGKTTIVNGNSSEIQLYKDVSMVDKKVVEDEKVPSFYPIFDKIFITNNNTDVTFSQMSNTGGGLTVLHEGQHYILGLSNIQFEEYYMLTNISWSFHTAWIQDQIRVYDQNFIWDESMRMKSYDAVSGRDLSE